MTEFLKSNTIHDGTLLVYRGSMVCIDESKGDMTSDTLFAVASVSKLYTHALIFQLMDDGVLGYETEIADVLPRNVTKHLPHAEYVTVRHLLDQTSGFPNYEMDRQPGGTVLMEEILRRDRRVEFMDALQIISRLPARSTLGGQKAYYADINAMLLGKIAETLTGKTAQYLLKNQICRPLGLVRTSWAKGSESIAPIYNGKRPVACQQYLVSQLYQGGIITTNHELMRFTRAFFGGELFRQSHIAQPTFRPIQFRPLRYGSGMMQLTLASPMASFFGIRELRGHGGITGSFAFYCPQKDLFATGTVNQFTYRPYAMMVRAIAACDKKRGSHKKSKK